MFCSYYLLALDCGMPPCLNNNTISLLLNGTAVGESGRYLCDPGYAFPNDISVKNFTCEKKTDDVNYRQTAEWSWNATVEGECECKFKFYVPSVCSM